MQDALSVFNYSDILAGLLGVTTPFNLFLMVMGVLVASFFAAAPGIGGLLLLSLLMMLLLLGLLHRLLAFFLLVHGVRNQYPYGHRDKRCS